MRPTTSALATCLALASALACETSSTGRHQLILVSDTELEMQANAAYDQMRAELPISKDAAKTNYVLCVSNAVTAVLPSSAPVRWDVTLFENEAANAFALPGAKIGVYTGLLDVAANQHQLAAVIGHEIAHVLERHANERASGNIAAGTAVLIGTEVLAGGKSAETKDATQQVLGAGIQVVGILPYSRAHESEADVLGLDLMARAGFDPREAPKLWENMAAASQGAPPEFLSTHPSHGTRIADLQKRLATAMPLYEQARAAGRRPACKKP